MYVTELRNCDFNELVYPIKVGSHLSSTPNDWSRNGQFSGQATLTNKVNGARERADLSIQKMLETNKKSSF